MAKKTAVYKDKETNAKITLIQNDDNTIDFEVDNAKGLMRLISKAIGFEYDPDWNTQTLGSKLIDVLNGSNQKTEETSSALVDVDITNYEKDGWKFETQLDVYNNEWVDGLIFVARDFQGFPADLKDHKEVKALSINPFANVTTLDEEVKGFDNVIAVSLSNLRLQSFPVGLSKLKNLKRLSLDSTWLSSIPDNLTGFQALEDLDLTVSGLTVNDVKNLQKLPNLRRLRLDYELSDSDKAEIEKILPNVEIRY